VDGDFFDATTVQAKVGSDSKYISADYSQPISDMQVVGDTVYVSVDLKADGSAAAREGDHNNEHGIFASTAIFDQDGLVKSWTPWQRVSGFTERVAGFGVDPDTQRIWYLKGDGKKVVKVTDWGEGDARAVGSEGIHDGVPLSKAIASYKSDDYGVLSLTSFDGETLGFKEPTNKHDRICLMVATGNKKVSLIEGGKIKARGTANVFETTQKFVGHAPDARAADDTVINFVGNDLDNLGPITCCEVARSAPAAGSADKGWLFVGGAGGVAVLRDNNGKGWPNGANQGLEQLKHGAAGGDYPGGANFEWKQLKDANNKNPFGHIRKLVADGWHLYVLTRDTLYRIAMATDDMKNGKVADANIAPIVKLSDGPHVASVEKAALAAYNLGLNAKTAGNVDASNARNAAFIIAFDYATLSAIEFVAAQAVSEHPDSLNDAALKAKGLVRADAANNPVTTEANDAVSGATSANDIRNLIDNNHNETNRIVVAANETDLSNLNFEVTNDAANDGAARAIELALGQAVRAAFNNKLNQNQDLFLDMMLVRDKLSDALAANNYTSLLIATSKGLLQSNKFAEDLNTAGKKPYFRYAMNMSSSEDSPSGTVLRLDFVNTKRGGILGGEDPSTGDIKVEGNIHALALDKAGENLNVYRFYVGDGEVKAFKENYAAGGARTDYFYKVGELDPGLVPYIEPGGIDLVGKASTYGHGNSDFATAVPQVPIPEAFLEAGKPDSAINLGHVFVDDIHYDGVEVRDSASGAIYIPGEFGVLVDE
jgi:hypothetical protein